MAFLPAAVNTVFVSAMPDGGKSKAAELITESNDEAYDAGLIENSTGIPEETGADNKENRENSGTEKTYNVSVFEDYITGVVAAEMPASFEAEALKAQAVAARTYAKRRIDAGNTLDDMIKNGGQAYNSVEDMKNKWKDSFDENYSRIKNAVEETKGEIMVYDGEPILAVFHAISSGKTETAGNVWSNDEPYLKSVESPMDTEAQNFTAEVSIPLNTVISKLQEKHPELAVTKGNLVAQTQIIERSESGYIKTIQIGNVVFTGREVRELLGLRSSDFTLRQDGDSIIFTTKGYGHGAGMSQYGANALAQEGKDYHEILKYYYTGISFLTE